MAFAGQRLGTDNPVPQGAVPATAGHFHLGQKTLSDLQLTEAPLTIEVALAIPSINFSHGDPADQFIAATAKVFDLTLITADDHLLKLPGIRVLPNR